ncbi:MAG: T9SS type A sorting domain-containing protein [Bacteroidales bacterium]|nr:T9SS type A sorting domain-containing protein [Bacteroidales bacterium]
MSVFGRGLLILGVLFHTNVNYAQLSFTKSSQNIGAGYSYQIVFGDIDNDGDIDALTTSDLPDDNKIWLNDGKANYMESENKLVTGNPGIALADLDNDGDLDVFISRSSGTEGIPNKVMLNDGTGSFTGTLQELGLKGSNDVALDDLDGDGDIDAFVCNHRTYQNGEYLHDGQHEVWLNDGTGYFTGSGQDFGDGLGTDVELGDIDGDGDTDAIVANNDEDPKNEIWLNDGNGYFSEGNILSVNFNSNGVALGDLDGDNDLDLFFANSNSNKVLFNNGNGTFTDSGQSLGNLKTNDIALGDLDNDGDLDAFSANREYGVALRNEIWINDGNGFFTNSNLEIGHGSSWSGGICDYDSDGDLDIFLMNDGNNELWVNNLIVNSVDQYSNVSFFMYPNPASDQLIISFDNTSVQAAKVEIYNIPGKLIFSETNRNAASMVINLSDTSQGIYILRIEANGDIITKKIMKKY